MIIFLGSISSNWLEKGRGTAMFSKEQIEEIDLLKELCQGVLVEGRPIVCFEVLSDIAHGKYEFSKLYVEDLLLVEEQLLGYIEFWEKADWLDNQIVSELSCCQLYKLQLILNDPNIHSDCLAFLGVDAFGQQN